MLRRPYTPSLAHPMSRRPRSTARRLGLARASAALAALGAAVLGLAGLKFASLNISGAGPPSGPLPEGRPALGMNLVYQSYWSSQLAFTDLFRQSGEWLPQRVDSYEWDTGEELRLDEDGWIVQLASGQAAGTLVASDLGGRYPAGVYDVLYAGRGALEVSGDGRVIDRQPGHLKVLVEPSDTGLRFKLTETDPADPLRDLRCVMPGFLETYKEQPFHPDFLAWLQPFETLRFMDWSRTNNSSISAWEDRTRPTAQTQGSDQGVALELQIDLCNALDRDGWFCVPHLADDDYVRRFAELLAERLEPQRTAWIEYSNEVWNGQFAQARWAAEQGLAAGLSDNRFQAQLRFYSQRSIEVLGTVAEVYGPGRRDDLRLVLAGQNVNPWVGEQILEHRAAHERIDAYAVAPYVGATLGSPERKRDVIDFDLDGVFSELRQDVRDVLDHVESNARICGELGIELVAYEAGQHLAGHGGVEDVAPIAALFRSANRRPEMAAIYTDLLDGWVERGGGLICAWNSIERYTKWGSWGTVEFIGQTREEAPKLGALLDFAERLAAGTSSATDPGKLPGRDPSAADH